jgi:hypothetical protein
MKNSSELRKITRSEFLVFSLEFKFCRILLWPEVSLLIGAIPDCSWQAYFKDHSAIDHSKHQAWGRSIPVYLAKYPYLFYSFTIFESISEKNKKMHKH